MYARCTHVYIDGTHMSSCSHASVYQYVQYAVVCKDMPKKGTAGIVEGVAEIETSTIVTTYAEAYQQGSCTLHALAHDQGSLCTCLLCARHHIPADIRLPLKFVVMHSSCFSQSLTGFLHWKSSTRTLLHHCNRAVLKGTLNMNTVAILCMNTVET